MANIITLCRILLCVFMLLFAPFSAAFYIIYAFAGLTDVADSIVARKTNTISATGSKLDTVADFVFAAVCMLKLLPVLNVSGIPFDMDGAHFCN